MSFEEVSRSPAAEPSKPESQASGDAPKESQTASDFIDSQLKLEADAREALPFSFDHCTQPLGSLRQNVFSCTTCNPPPDSPSDDYEPAGICYGCSIACHGDHTLVEIFARRNFTCDCGTARIKSDAPCTLRIDPATGIKGPVRAQKPAEGNTYNQNFRNRFCGCGELYDAHKQKGTMYQCLGLAKEQEGGCGEDWWHPECLLGLPRDWYLSGKRKDADSSKLDKTAATNDEAEGKEKQEEEEEEHPVPPGFPDESEFETLICYKCVGANSWIRKYANAPGFKSLKKAGPDQDTDDVENTGEMGRNRTSEPPRHDEQAATQDISKKRKAEDEPDDASATSKKVKAEDDKETPHPSPLPASSSFQPPKHASLPDAPSGSFSILTLHDTFRERFCRCVECYPSLSKHPQLLEEEETYEPPVSEDGEGGDGPAGSVGTGSLLDRGEAALSNMDRVRAIEGVMAYNHMRDKLKTFLQPFADSGQAVGAEDIKTYFEKLRGDDAAMREAALALRSGGSGDGDGGPPPEDDNRREENGY